MTRKLYGSLDNRIDENRMLVNKIEIGTPMTEYLWSDRHPYETTRVIDQKHVYVRRMDHKKNGDDYSNDWVLVSNEKNAEYYLTKRGNYWYWTVIVNADILNNLDTDDADKDIETRLFLLHNDIDINKLKEKGKVTRYHKANVTFGKAEYYYDYEF